MESSREILINLDRLQLKMDEHGMDAVVARAGVNYTYLSGIAYPGTLARHLDLADSPRGTYLIWPRVGEPIIVLNAIAEELTRRNSWVKSFEVYEGYVEHPAERVAKAIVQMDLSGATVGFERNFISAGDWEFLQLRLPSMRMVDSTRMMDEVRAIKTEGEIRLIREGAKILDNAYAKVFKQIRPGVRERDVHAAIVAECLAGGCEFVHGILTQIAIRSPMRAKATLFLLQVMQCGRTTWRTSKDIRGINRAVPSWDHQPMSSSSNIGLCAIFIAFPLINAEQETAPVRSTIS